MRVHRQVHWGIGAGLLFSAALFFSPKVERGGAHPGQSEHAHQGPESAGIDVCASGCSAVPELQRTLTAQQFDALIAAFAKDPRGAENTALETLLFHGADSLALLDAREPVLDPGREDFLRAELARTHAILDVRVIDEHGVERLRLGEERVPFGEKQHIHARETVALQSPEISGTVKRVGLKHLWARF